MKKKNKYLLLILIVLSVWLSIGYSAFNTKLEIDDINLTVRIDKDIRVDGFNIDSITNSSISNYEEYDYNKLIFGINLPNSNSTVKYKVKVTNYGNVDMGIYDIIGLPDNLEYTLEDYTFKTSIVSTKEFYINVKYKDDGYDSSNTNYNINLELKFSGLSSVITTGIKETTEVFGKAMDKSIIEYIEFVDCIEVPTEIESWDASLAKDESVIAWITDDDENGLYNLYIGGVIGRVIAPKDARYLFRDFTNVTEIVFSNKFDTSNATTMHNFFYNCYNLTTLDLSSFNTSKVTSMRNMFYNASSLTSLDLSNFDTSNVETMARMFHNCSSLTSLDISSFDTNKVADMELMFANSQVLTSLNLSGFNTSNVTSMSAMFYNASSLTSLDLSNFDTSNVTDMSSMFNYTSNLTNLNISNFDTSNVEKMNSMFSHCFKLSSLDLSNFDTSKVITINNMFYNMYELKTIYVSDKWNMSSVTESTRMFSGSTKLVGGAGTTYDTSYVDVTYARIDSGTDSPGYLTFKSS